MHHQARRLVEHDEMGVLVQDIERHGLTGNAGFLRWRHAQHNLVIWFDPPCWVFYRIGRCVSGGLTCAGLDQRLQTGAADFRRIVCQYLVEPRAIIFGAYNKAYVRVRGGNQNHD